MVEIYNLKKAQRQGLLFYPWEQYESRTGVVSPKPFQDVKVQQEPEFIDPQTGEKHYKCLECGETVPESKIHDWLVHPEEMRKYKYPEDINIEQLEKDLRHVIDLLWPIRKKLHIYMEGNEKKDPLRGFYNDYSEFKKEIPEIKSFIDSSQEIQKWCKLVSALHPDVYNSICGVLGKDVISGRVLLNLDLLFSQTEFEIKEYKRKAEQNKDFSVQVSSPICEECAENATQCEDCHKIILNPEDKGYQTTWSDTDYVCQQCIEDGDWGVCAECGLADRADEMRYVEDEGNYCEECAKKISNPEQYRYEIDEAAEQNPFPFKEWFPEGEDRTYLPFYPNNDLSQLDQQVRNKLEEEGCLNTTLDYQEGYCQHNGRKFKIVKFINKIRSDEAKGIKNAPDLTEEDKNYSIQKLNENFNYLIEIVTKSEFRKLKKQNDLEIVISQNPTDVATISTGRDWTSCMRLGGERNHEIFCLIEKGSLVAYLIRHGDERIEQPLARILIRRFENKQGQSIAVPEETIYGNAPSGFLETVGTWLEAKQSYLPKGMYKRVDDAYSDTFGREYEKIAQLIANAILKFSGGWYKKIKY